MCIFATDLQRNIKTTNKMRKLFFLSVAMMMATTTFAQSKVYFTKEITPESLVKIYKALGVEAKGRVAVKISTGEGGNTHYLKPTLIRNLVDEVNGTIVECCTAYGGSRQDPKKHWETIHDHGFDSIFAAGKTQDLFLESMAAAAQAVHEYFNGNIIYINVMNNMSVDCDCDGHPAKPELQDMGIMASLDPVAVDQACLDKVFNYQGKPGDDNKPLIQRINRQHGTYITDYAEKIGLGSKKYELINLDK